MHDTVGDIGSLPDLRQVGDPASPFSRHPRPARGWVWAGQSIDGLQCRATPREPQHSWLVMPTPADCSTSADSLPKQRWHVGQQRMPGHLRPPAAITPKHQRAAPLGGLTDLGPGHWHLSAAGRPSGHVSRSVCSADQTAGIGSVQLSGFECLSLYTEHCLAFQPPGPRL